MKLLLDAEPDTKLGALDLEEPMPVPQQVDSSTSKLIVSPHPADFSEMTNQRVHTHTYASESCDKFRIPTTAFAPEESMKPITSPLPTIPLETILLASNPLPLPSPPPSHTFPLTVAGHSSSETKDLFSESQKDISASSKLSEFSETPSLSLSSDDSLESVHHGMKGESPPRTPKASTSPKFEGTKLSLV